MPGTYKETGANRAGGVNFGSLLLQGVSAFALCTVALAAPAYAQEAEEGDDTIVVTGIRSSLRSSQEIKRNAEVFVDSITAEDIGALPDRSVTEALQRVPGVAISRFAAGVDPDHFSVEGSGVVVRGLNFVRSEFNGRDTFSANNGRALSFSDVPSELLGGVDVFKNQSADMIEGGLAGTVNLRTRVPFDGAGRVLSGSAEYNYGDFIEEWAPTWSVLYSDRFRTSGGEFGILLNYVDSDLKSRADGTQVSGYGCRPDLADTPCPANPTESIYARGAAFRSQQFDRGRIGYGGAGQWSSNDDTMLATFQFLRSESTQSWTEHAIEIATDVVNDNGDARPPTGSSWEFGSDGVFANGIITGPTGWRDDGGYNWRSGTCGSGCDPRSAAWGLQSNNIRRDVEQEYVTEDTGFNFKWTPNETWAFNFDWQHVESTVQNLDTTIWGSTYQNVDLQVRGDDLPIFTFLPPSQVDNPTPLQYGGAQCTSGGLANGPPFTLPQPAGGDPGSTCTTYFADGHQDFSDPYNNYWRSSMDHIEDSEGVEDAVRFDIERHFSDSSWLESVRFGGRWSERDQTTRFSQYNWGVLSEQWGGGGPVWFDDPVNGVPNANGYPCVINGAGTACDPAPGQPTSLQTELYTFENFLRGEVPVPTGDQPRLFYALNTAQNYDAFSEISLLIGDEWRNRFSATNTCRNGDPAPQNWVPLAQRCDVIPGTPFRPQEINPIVEETSAFYAMLRYGHDFDNGMALSGNLGVRYVQTTHSADGFVAFPVGGGGVPSDADCEPEETPPGSGIFEPDPRIICQPANAGLRNDLIAWSNGATIPSRTVNTYDHVLPSFNLKWDLNDEMLVRFGVSKAISRPELGLTRNFLLLSLDSSDNAFSAFGGPTLNANIGNPGLRPVESTNFDGSFEWYFADVGSLTGSVFYKNIDNVIGNGTIKLALSNNDVTVVGNVGAPLNSEDTAHIKGFEIAYQQTYDFLPAPFDGLGLNANYTYIDSENAAQSTLSATDPDVAAGRIAVIDTSLLPLQGLSEHNFNFVTFYEKGPIEARLAYSWRSEFLLTVRDVITPYAPIMNADTGQLDGSFRYRVTDNLSLGVQGVNLTNEITQTNQILNNNLLQAGRSWFMNDRRFVLFARANF